MPQFEDLVFTANFLRLTPGAEISAANQIKSNQAKCHVYKFLGSYDLLRVELGSKLSQLDSDLEVDGILEMSSITATALPSEQWASTQEFHSKFEIICQYPIISLIFLELQTEDGYSARLLKQIEILNKTEEYCDQNTIEAAL